LLNVFSVKGAVLMVEASAEATKFINDLLAKNQKQGFGVRIYVAGVGCSGPQFGMAFQEKKKEGDLEQKVDRFSFYYDDEAREFLDGCTIDYVETPQGSGLIIQNPNFSGCGSCGGSCH
jgi:iron-sulfur cluster assembly accessory protein